MHVWLQDVENSSEARLSTDAYPLDQSRPRLRPVESSTPSVTPREIESNLPEQIRYSYIRLTLQTPLLSSELRARLERIGIECLEEGALYEAYGIISETMPMLAALEQIEQVLAVERNEPPCTK